ncbi:MAG: flagellar motor switch protein FliG [Planctomycetes bacterium]|nr:flagellar motor switch protein FliG [Planctomycetota bacterium]
MSGSRKAAILLLSLEPDYAARILSQLDRASVERLSFEIARLEDVSKHDRDLVLDEFYQTNLAQQYVEAGGLEYARELLSKALPAEDVNAIMQNLDQSLQQQPFSFLARADSENLLTFIQDEHPQTISLILSHLGPQQASEVMKGLPQAKQVDVVKRMSRMERTDPDVIARVEGTLQTRLASFVTQEFQKAGGVEKVAEILNLTDRATEKAILELIEEEDPELVEQIRKLMFVFEDLILVNDKGIQAVLKEIDNEELALGLKTASEELKEKIFKNMSQRAAELVKEDMEYMGPVRLSDVEAAQQTIVEIVRRLEEQGDVIVSGRGGEEEIIE